MPKISIIVPIYNVENYLRQGLDSLINQTFKDIEIICINDCSPDNSLSILKEYTQKDSRIKIIDLKENKGQGNARNIAIKEAKSDYIMFLDPDDWYELDACEKAYNQIIENNNDFVIFDFSRFYEETEEKTLDAKYSTIFNQLENKTNINPNDCNFYFFLNSLAWNKIYKTSFLQENSIEFSTERFLEDIPFFVKVVTCATNFSFIAESLYNYRMKANEQMTLNYTNYYSHVVSSHKENYSIIRQTKNNNLIKNYLIYTINSTSHWFDKFTSINKEIKKDFYELLRTYYIVLNEENDINLISNKINKKMFKLVLKNKTYKSFELSILPKKILKNIFSTQKNAGYKTIIILGLKFNLKRKNKKV